MTNEADVARERQTEAARKALWDGATDAQRSAMYRDWEAQRPLPELAKTRPHDLFVACWLAGYAAALAALPSPDEQDSALVRVQEERDRLRYALKRIQSIEDGGILHEGETANAIARAALVEKGRIEDD